MFMQVLLLVLISIGILMVRFLRATAGLCATQRRTCAACWAEFQMPCSCL